MMLLSINQFMITGGAKTTAVRITIAVFFSLLATHTLPEREARAVGAMQHPSSVEMDAAATVIGVLIALGFVIFISALVAAYVLWKDGCCKKRQEEQRSGDAEGRGKVGEKEREREEREEGERVWLFTEKAFMWCTSID